MKKNHETAIAAITCLDGIISSLEIRNNVAKNSLINEVISAAIEKLEPKSNPPETGNAAAESSRPGQNGHSNSEAPVFQVKVAVIISHCYEAELLPQLDRITAIMSKQASELESAKLEKTCVPFLKTLVQKLGVSSPALRLSSVQSLFRSILSSAVSKCTPLEFSSDNWTLPARGCYCLDCDELDIFLRSPTLSEVVLTVFDVKVRPHLRQRLQSDTGKTLDVFLDWPKITVTKRPDHAVQNVADRCHPLQASILSIGTVPLKILLAEHFDSIMDLKPIVLPSTPLPGMPEMTAILAPITATSTFPTTRPFSNGYVDLSMDSSDEDEPEPERPHILGKGCHDIIAPNPPVPPGYAPAGPLGPASNATTNQILPSLKRSYSDIRYGIEYLVESSTKLLKRVHIEAAQLAKAAQASRSPQPSSKPKEGNKTSVAESLNLDLLSNDSIRKNVSKIRQAYPRISIIAAKKCIDDRRR